MDEMAVNNSIRDYINGHGIKQIYIANISGISIKKLNDIVNNRVKCTISDMIKISRALGLNDEFFLINNSPDK